MSLTEIFGEPISVYSRADALNDGTLVDVTATAREAGIKYPTALTLAAWERCVAWNAEDTDKQVPQDEGGRLWDVLWMLRFAIAGMRADGKGDDNEVLYTFRCVPRDGRTRSARITQLRALIGPGDDGEPVITIMLPSED
jgi:Family of unknown function (DUF6573)